MRRFSLIAILSAVLFCLSNTASAVPAKPGRVFFRQPDGSTVTVHVHGDEWFHYVTDEAGNLMEENAEGFMVKSTMTMETLNANMARAQAARSSILQKRDEVLLKAQTKGSPKIPVILVQFSDKSFSISNPKTAFTNLLTQTGYSQNGCSGSVLDYYSDQSRGAYTPQFVVMDVVTLKNRMSTYGSNDDNAAVALYEACQQLDATVDFSQFDNDKDGKIDMALMYFAGYNEAEGGPSSTIWPHQYYVPYVVSNPQSFDGVKLDRYFCTSELKGYSGTNMCGIGTTCHEFAHSLGLPDFYDTNYNEYGDGEAGATYSYDVMCSGSYNNNGCTPPWMNAEELVMLGWMDSISEITSVGNVTIPSIGSSAPAAYKTPTSVSGEYFLYESRPGTGWDAPLKGGMLVYHVDKSTAHRITYRTSATQSATVSAYNLWANWASYNAINCNGSHPCFYIVPSGNQNSLNYSGSSFTYPGPSSVTNFTPKEWAGTETGFALTGISFDSSTGSVSFRLTNSNACGISGVVMNSDGIPISGATMTLRAVGSSSAPSGGSAKEILKKAGSISRASGAVLQTVTTDASGSYSISLESSGTFVLEASKSGYVSQSATVEVSRLVTQNFYLMREGETAPSEIVTFPTDGELGAYGSDETTSWDIMCANIFPAAKLSAYAGKQIKSISFMISGETDSNGNTTTTGTVHAILDMGSERKACVEVEKPLVNTWNDVDISDLGIRIESGKDVFAGYALKNWTYSYPIVATNAASADLIGYLADYDLTTMAWDPWDGLVLIIKIKIGDYSEPETGYNFIVDPKNGSYSVGDIFELSLKETQSERRPDSAGVTWFYDDEPVSGPVTLSKAGVHTITARFTTVSGTSKTVDLEIDVR